MRIFSSGWSDNKDGPGLRYIIYCKGCNLNCCYCGNPESINYDIEVLRYKERDSKVDLAKCCQHNSDCKNCRTFECVNVYRHRQMELVGEDLPIGTIIEKIQSMRHMIDGVSIGGGEPTLQINEVLELIKELKNLGIHTAIESNASTANYQKVLGVVDYLISDLKAGTDEGYKKITGQSNAAVKTNLRAAAKLQKDFLIRIPLITDYNTSEIELMAMREFLLELKSLHGGELSVQTLRLHHAGLVKYQALDRDYLLQNAVPPSVEFQKNFEDLLRKDGFDILSF
ncbi:MAG: radical SAM protein [Lentisphaeria bacterium]|nr:radical SAM protein [Lentisphaeria bacterium]